MSDLTSAAAQLAPELTRIRRAFHRIPELGLQLPRTQELLLEQLADLPLEISLGQDLTSVVAVLRGGRAEGATPPSVLLRADMDALPVQEKADSPFRSLTPDRMHACGHDLHMAMCIGAARLLAERRETLPGDVVFMFQPGEEGHDGASYMLREGVLNAAGSRVRAAYALHVFSGAIPSAQFAARAGTAMSASDDLRVVVQGRGGHGSTPHRANDPLVVAAEMVLGLQTMVTRKFDIFDPIVVTVGSFHAGQQRNTISESTYFEATVRTFSSTTRQRTQEMVPALIRGIADAHGVHATCEWEGGYPLLRNDEGEVEFAQAQITDMFGPARYQTLPRPFAASEDFARVLNEVPGALIALSAVPAGTEPAKAAFNHSPDAYFDEGILPDGAALLARLATTRLAEDNAVGLMAGTDPAAEALTRGMR